MLRAVVIIFAINLALWLLGYFYAPSVGHARIVNGQWISNGLSFQNGEIFFQRGWENPPPNRKAGFSAGLGRIRNRSFVFRWSKAGFFLFTFDEDGANGFTQAGVPQWFVAVVTAPAVVVWFNRRRRAKRRALAGRCVGCGYDLRASAGRCPECGLAIEPHANDQSTTTSSAAR